jgi:type IV pilus assembly protein PilN
MIKINLLPIRQARKRESVKQQLILFAVLLVGAGVGLYLWNNHMTTKVDDKKKQIRTTKQQIEQYKRAIGEVEKFKGLEETLERKLKIIESLVKGKSGPVKVLDRLSQLVPKQVWLTNWSEGGGKVTCEGEALSNKYVADFVSALKESYKDGTAAALGDGEKTGKKYFTNVKLVGVEADKQSRFVTFKITMKVNYSI